MINLIWRFIAYYKFLLVIQCSCIIPVHILKLLYVKHYLLRAVPLRSSSRPFCKLLIIRFIWLHGCHLQVFLYLFLFIRRLIKYVHISTILFTGKHFSNEISLLLLRINFFNIKHWILNCFLQRILHIWLRREQV